VLGEPVMVDGRPVVVDGKPKRDFGYQLRQFDEMLRGHDLVTRMTVVDAARPTKRSVPISPARCSAPAPT
jgi:hypothetical protein